MEAGDHVPVTPLAARPVSCYGTGPHADDERTGAPFAAIPVPVAGYGSKLGGKDSRLRESDDEW